VGALGFFFLNFAAGNQKQRKMKRLFLLMICGLTLMSAKAQTPAEVLEAAQRVNNYFMKLWPDPTKDTFVKKIRPSSLWTRAVYYEGLMALYEVDPNEAYIDYTDRWANYHKWTPRDGVKTVDADNQCCGQTYLDRYFMTKDAKKLERLQENLDNQIATGRCDYWTWIDAIQMAMPVYSKMYLATGEKKYMDYAMDAYRWSRNTCAGGLFNIPEGLWWRDKDFVAPYKESDGKNCYWSRGNGWVYAALIRVMDDLKKNGKVDKEMKGYYKQLKKDFIIMSKALLKCQREDGFWNVSLVSPATFGGKEASGTALFLAGMSWGIRNGLLKAKKYQGCCDKACKALITESIHPNGFLGYLQGTGKEPKDGQPVTYTKVPDFEDYGAGCVLLGLVEYYKLIK